MHARANTTPTVNNPLRAIISRTEIFTGVDPVVMYIQYKSDMLAHSKSSVQTI
jgi:hypothetical protein